HAVLPELEGQTLDDEGDDDRAHDQVDREERRVLLEGFHEASTATSTTGGCRSRATQKSHEHPRCSFPTTKLGKARYLPPSHEVNATSRRVHVYVGSWNLCSTLPL